MCLGERHDREPVAFAHQRQILEEEEEEEPEPEAEEGAAAPVGELKPLDEAEELYRESRARWESLPRDHPMVAISLLNLATLLADRGELDEVAKLYREALDGIRDNGLDCGISVKLSERGLRID